MTETPETETVNEKSDVSLAKVSPVKIKADTQQVLEPRDEENLEREKYLIEAIRLLLREFGIRKSGAAIFFLPRLPLTYSNSIQSPLLMT